MLLKPSSTPLAIFLSASALTSLVVPPTAGGTTGAGITKLFSTTTHSIAIRVDKTTFSQCIQPVNITFSKRVFTSQTDFPDVRFSIFTHFIKVPTAKEETAKSRRYSVGYLPNRGKPNPSPQLIISGKWLKELGFEVGSHYTLTRQAGQLVIRLAENE